jgi:hypothetical protein
MIRPAAPDRFRLFSSANNHTRANFSSPAVSRRTSAVIGLLTAGTLCLPATAQVAVPQPQIQPRTEFRTAPRPLITQTVDRTRLVPTRGALRPEVATAQDLGPHNPAELVEHIQLILQRPQERQAAFDAEVEALHQFGNPSYHQWLTPEAIGAEFGPSPADIATLTGFLEAEGFTINNVGKSGMFIDFTGTVAQVQQSFHTEIHDLRLATGEQRSAAVRDAQLPEALAPLVAGFLSLSNILPRPTLVPARRHLPLPGSARAQSNASPNDSDGLGDFNVGAQDFYTIYNETPLINAGTIGSGITIALLEQTNIHTADVTTFRTMMNILPSTPPLTVMHGVSSKPCGNPRITSQDEEGEAALDTEWAGAAAPGATLLFMSCASTAMTGGIFLSAEAVIDNNLATTMSLSYGETEIGNSSDNMLFSNLWEQAAAQGETVVVSAGDAGSANSADQNQSIASHGLAVNALGSTPYNVAAGGTDFQDFFNDGEGDTSFNLAHYWNSSNGPGNSSALSYVAEMTWNDTCASSLLNFWVEGNTTPNSLCDDPTNGPMFTATSGGGGGVSTLQPRPSWQNGTVFGIPPTSMYNNRLLPDVSLFAANGFWSHALDYYQSDLGTTLQSAGGTSFVSPQLAGIFALIAQKTIGRLGQPNYVLYNMAGAEFGTTSYIAGDTCNGTGASGVATTATAPAASCIFYDVESGNISQACTPGSLNCFTTSPTATIGTLSSTIPVSSALAYPTTQGYDLATGIGSFNITNLVENWQTAASGGISFTPTVTVTATSASYTYGLPSAITYTAVVSGPGSFPTGSVTFSGSPTIATIGVDALVASTGCSTGATCTESTTQAFTPTGTLAAGSYTITAAYLSTNENYMSGSGTTALTINPQTPAVTVSPASGATTANFSAHIAYTGTGFAPSGGLTFTVDSGAPVTATCTGSTSPLTCTFTGYNTSALTVGSHTLTATSIADGNYTSANGSNTLTITIATAPTIAFTVPNHHAMDTPFTVAATSNSAGAITYSVVSGPATISANTVTLTSAGGTIILQASQAANGSFSAGTQNASFTVIAGSVWLANGTGSLSVVDLTGTAITGASGFTGGGVGTIASPLGLAFDASGNIWIANSNGIGKFNYQGTAVTATPYTAGGISNPRAIAIDGAGQVWVANAGGTVSVLSNTGTAVSPSTGYSGPGTTPGGIAIDISGSVWIPGTTANTLTRILGAAVPVVPLATAGAGIEP